MSINIPVRDSEEVVEVKIDALPEEAGDITDILRAEIAPLNIWIQFAIEYYKQGKIQQFLEILQEACRPEIASIYNTSIKERIQVYTTLAGYYLKLAENEKDEKKRAEYHNTINSLLHEASSIDQTDDLVLTAKGLLLMQQGNLESAKIQFDSSLSLNPDSIPAMLGKARILFNQENYKEALQLYKRVLEVSGGQCPANVRLGIGLCNYKLGNLTLARMAFERCLQLQENAEALVGLAILDLNSNKPDKTKTGMEYLKRAYQLDRNNSMVLNHLANHFFYKGDMKKVSNLALNAFHKTGANEIKAESCYLMARVYHAQQNYENAFKFYYQILTYWPNYPLGNFGLGQMYIHRGEIDKAIQHFEAALKFGHNFETHKILGSLYAEKGKIEEALIHLRKANEMIDNDEEILIEIGQLERYNFNAALEAYEKARKLMEEKGKTIPFELWNNLGALYLKVNNIEKAEENLMKALNLTDATMDEFKPEHVTIIYNIGRLREAQEQYDEAREIYKNILSQHPSYIEAYLRLGSIAFKKGNMIEAIKWCEIAKDIKPKDITIWALMGSLYLKREEWSKAQAKFEHIVTNIDRNDSFANLALGYIYYACAKHGDPKEEKHLTYASQFFTAALKKDPNNVYAALAIGAVMGERGYLDAAKDIFSKVRESTGKIPEIWINLGHISMAQKQYTQAAKIYENCLKRFYKDSDPKVLHFLAKAYFEDQKLDECKEVLEKLIQLKPETILYQYNLGITYHEMALKILKDGKKNVESAQKAVNSVEEARKIFESVIQKDKRLSKKAQYYFDQTTETLETAHKFKKEAEEQQKKKEQFLEEQRKALERTLQEREEEKLRKEREEQERKAKLAQIAEQNEKKKLELLEKWRMRERKREEQKEQEDNFIEPEIVPEQEPKKRSQKKDNAKKDAPKKETPKKRKRTLHKGSEKRKKKKTEDDDEE